MTSRVFIEASDTGKINARTGIQSVVRGLIYGLHAMGCEAIPVRWSFRRRCLTPLQPQWRRNLGISKGGAHWLPTSSLLDPLNWDIWRKSLGLNYRTPLHRHPIHSKQFACGWIILPEIMEGHHARLVRDYARTHGLRTAGIFHDAIAWRHPEYVRHWTRQQHADYMTAFGNLDLVIAVSRESAEHYLEFAKCQGMTPPRLTACSLPAQVLGQDRETMPTPKPDNTVRIVCVSTLEPRKNHSGIIEAFQLACSIGGTPNWELHFVGAKYGAAPEIAEFVRETTKNHRSIFWHEGVDAVRLREFYRACDFTVFGSSIEGFGLPVLESLWFGKPCVCSDQGVMAENAEGGGCLTVDVSDPQALADAMASMAGDESLRKNLTQQALARPLKTWQDYASEVLETLKTS